MDYLECLLNEVYVNGTKEEKIAFFRSHEGMIRTIEQRLRNEGIMKYAQNSDYERKGA